MPSLARGESSTAVNPVLDLWTAIGNPPVLTDVAVLEIQIYDVSTPAKRGTPVQVEPAAPGTWLALDPTLDAGSGGHRLGVGHYYGPWTVPLAEPIGDHKIVWRWKHTALSPYETLTEEFYVAASVSGLADTYCSIADVRAEGFTDPPYTDARILFLAVLATRYVDKVTGRWFNPRTFDDTNPLIMDGTGGRVLHLEIPVIRLDRLWIENQGVVEPDLEEVDLGVVRVYNRHMTGQVQPDDRENPRIAFVQGRINQVVSTGFFPTPRWFPEGRQNVWLEGVFGYTDPDGTTFGETPALIRQAACRLVTRDLKLDSDYKGKLNVKNAYRIKGDKEGKDSVTLQDLWLRGAYTGDSEIDNVLMAYKRPPRVAVP